MARSLRVTPGCIEKVKLAVKRNSFPSVNALAIHIGFSRSTVSSYLNGKPVDYLNFVELSECLGMAWQAIADLPEEPASSGFYVDRPPIESQCYQEIVRPGALIRIKAPQKMGKTRLINQILDYATARKYRTVRLNLMEPDRETIADLNKFLRWFCCRVTRLLGLEHQVDDRWDEGAGSNDNCNAYFEDCILPNKDSPLVLGLDNVDRLFPYEKVAPDFFSLLRSWYEDANVMDVWKKLRLVIAHSTHDYIPLNINKSPFNVGLPIELPEFNRDQVKRLAERYKIKAKVVEELMAMVGGHPDLVQEAFIEMKNHPEMKLVDMLRSAPTEAGLYDRHLRERLEYLQKDASLAGVMKMVVEANEPVRVEPDQGFKLHSMGLVRKCDNEVEPRCNLYRLYFRDRLS